MSILGIGPLELIFIFIIALLILGPKDIAKAGLTLGRLLRSIIQSDTWKTIRSTASEIRNIPNRLMRESGLNDAGLPTEKEIREMVGVDEINSQAKKISTDLSDWTSQPNTIAPPNKTPSTIPSSTTPASKSPTPPKTDKPSETDWATPRPRPQPVEVQPTEGQLDNAQSVTPPINDNLASTTTSYPPPIQPAEGINETPNN